MKRIFITYHTAIFYIYSDKFFLTSESLGTNIVVITRFFCNKNVYIETEISVNTNEQTVIFLNKSTTITLELNISVCALYVNADTVIQIQVLKRNKNLTVPPAFIKHTHF